MILIREKITYKQINSNIACEIIICVDACRFGFFSIIFSQFFIFLPFHTCIPGTNIRDYWDLHSVPRTLRRSVVSCAILRKYCMNRYNTHVHPVSITPAHHFGPSSEEYRSLVTTMNFELCAKRNYNVCTICSGCDGVNDIIRFRIFDICGWYFWTCVNYLVTIATSSIFNLILM